MTLGVMGKILWVDLPNETFKEENLPEEIYRKYIGGYGLGAYLIYKNTPSKYDALGPDAIFGFFPGLFSGTAAPFSGRYMVAGKSPLTGTWGDANSGGTFSPEIKKCGYDAILFKGIAKRPVYVAIIDDRKEILDASEIWGLDIVEAEKKLKEQHGKVKTAGIGQAGENLSLIAGIANDKGRIAGRSGIGAVMGSKKLKMLALKGNKRVEYNDQQEFNKWVKSYHQARKSKPNPGLLTRTIVKTIPKMAKTIRRAGIGMDSSPVGLMRNLYKTFGTTSSNTISIEIGDSPVKNWSGIGHLDFPHKEYKELTANSIDEYKVRSYGCITCPIQCGAIMKVPELDLEETHRPEYETCTSFGADLLNGDLISIFNANEICNRAAIDTISAGATLAFAIECYENGILTKENTDGLELTWGNSEAIIAMLKKMIKREGLGDLLADGSKVAAEKIGKGSEKYAMHSLGQEIAMHNPRVFKSLAYTYAFDPTPGRHTAASVDFFDLGPINKFMDGFKLPKGWKKDIKKKHKAQVLNNNFLQALNSAGLCMFSTLFGYYPIFDLIRSLTGWKMSLKEFLQCGERIHNLRQAFTLREGIDITKNELPARVTGEEPWTFKKGPTKGITAEYRDYYKSVCKEAGWNPENGYPLPEKLRSLDLEFVEKDLYS
ncbi:MAG: aldehyde ferredoxin oxidoreductase family protein [Promethearchaeota archaeon]